MKVLSFFLLVVILVIPVSLFGHHAMEYIEMESYSTAMKGEFIFHLHFDYMVNDDSNPALDHWEYIFRSLPKILYLKRGWNSVQEAVEQIQHLCTDFRKGGCDEKNNVTVCSNCIFLFSRIFSFSMDNR